MQTIDSRDPAVTLGLAFGGGVVATTLLVLVGGTRHVDACLAAYVASAALAALTARWWAGLAAGVVLWLFYDGFLIGRHAVLAWHGSVDGWRLAFILAGAVGGLLAGRVVRQTAPAGTATGRAAGRAFAVPGRGRVDLGKAHGNQTRQSE